MSLTTVYGETDMEAGDCHTDLPVLGAAHRGGQELRAVCSLRVLSNSLFVPNWIATLEEAACFISSASIIEL